MYMSWKQKCEEERVFYVNRWRWNAASEEYDIVSNDNLTFEEAKAIFDHTKCGCEYDQVDLFRETSEDTCEKIALKNEAFPDGTWDQSEM